MTVFVSFIFRYYFM